MDLINVKQGLREAGGWIESLAHSVRGKLYECKSSSQALSRALCNPLEPFKEQESIEICTDTQAHTDARLLDCYEIYY